MGVECDAEEGDALQFICSFSTLYTVYMYTLACNVGCMLLCGTSYYIPTVKL